MGRKTTDIHAVMHAGCQRSENKDDNSIWKKSRPFALCRGFIFNGLAETERNESPY
jgi:hypothetical protein